MSVSRRPGGDVSQLVFPLRQVVRGDEVEQIYASGDSKDHLLFLHLSLGTVWNTKKTNITDQPGQATNHGLSQTWWKHADVNVVTYIAITVSLSFHHQTLMDLMSL